jgi:hypothetical protein
MQDTKSAKGSISETKTKTSPVTGTVVKDAAGQPVKVTDTKPKR